MPFCVVAQVAGGWEIVNPPTEMVAGTPPPAPSQLGAETVPGPGEGVARAAVRAPRRVGEGAVVLAR